LNNHERAIQKDRMANQRREAFLAFMSENKLNPRQWSRMAGLTQPNSIYNFLNGGSRSLSIETAQRLADVIPNTSVGDLFGEKDLRGITQQVKYVPLRGVAAGGVWRRKYLIPSSDQIDVQVLNGLDADEALTMVGDSADKVYPSGSILLMKRFQSDLPLKDGTMVIVQRFRKVGSVQELEITARKINVGEAVTTLTWVSHNPRFQGGIVMPRIYKGDAFSNPMEPDTQKSRTRYSILGVVKGFQGEAEE